MNTSGQTISKSGLFFFWIPLAFTWLMMALEGPILTAVIARLPEAKFNLAAFGIAISLAMLVEAPIIMIMAASTALVDSSHNLRKLFRYTLAANGLVTLVMVVLIIPPIFRWITDHLMQLPDPIGETAHHATALFLPWPAAIGFRRFYQGILIRNKLTRRVAYGTVIRLGCVILVSSAYLMWWKLPGAYLGAVSLSVAVVAEAIATRLMVGRVLKNIREKPATGKEELTYREIHRFYFPLALTSMLTLATYPMVTLFLGQSRMAIESLAVMPVLHAFSFIFLSIGLSYQEVVVARVGNRFEMLQPLRSFASGLGVVLFVLLSLVSFSPIINLWYLEVSGLTESLTSLVILPTQVLVVLPALTVWISFQRGLLLVAKQTKAITVATLIELASIIFILFVCIGWFDLLGVTAAAWAYVIGRLAAIVYLIKPSSMATVGYTVLCSKKSAF